MKHNAMTITSEHESDSALAIMTLILSMGEGHYGTNKYIDSCEEHRSRPWRFGGRVRLGGRLQSPEEGRLHGRDCPESDHLAGRRRGGHEARDRRAERPGDSRRSLIWRSSDHGSGQRPKVAGLVYITAFAPDKGESAASLIKDPPPGAPAPPILPPQDGYLFLDKAKFPAAFAGDVSPDVASFMADSQVPWGVEALGGAITQPAWRTKPSWYLISTEDKMIPPDAQRAMSKRAGSTVVEVKSSHSVFLSHPQAVADLIEQAATGALVATKEGATNAAAD